ncbi:MAG: flippase, partial [Candidatus Falkowbacteria bacterium]|nr:flippase [Candidatus Falkowbacteria bacterium]
VWLVLGFLISYRASNLRIKAWSFNKNLAKEMLASSWLLMLSAAASYIYLKIDQVMIGAYLGVREVGLYAAGVKFVEVWYFIPAMICASLFPAIINARKANNLAMYRSRLRNLYWLLAIIAVLIALPLTFLAAWAINLLFGAAYLGAVEILQIYVWSGVGLFIGWGINQYFLSANRLRAIFCFNLFSMLLNIGLNLIFIPRFGLNGAAWATLISYSVGPLVVWAIGTKKKMRS